MSEIAVGLMSGTSLDGVDAALVELDDEMDGGPRLRLLAFRSTPYGAEFRRAILHAIDIGSTRGLARLNVALGERFAAAASAVLEAAGMCPGALSHVASHGQTIWHEPGRATLQLGDPAVVAEALGVTVVSDFRSRDVAAGGQGAPLVPVADVDLWGREDGGRLLLNLGGMANVTWVPRRGARDRVVAFDTGPGVAVIDAIARRIDPAAPFDVDGRLAAAGTPVETAVNDLLGHPFFEMPPPRSTGREMFGEAFAMALLERLAGARPEDVVSTAATLTIRSVSESVDRWLPAAGDADVLVSGGGARNPVLLDGLRIALAPRSVRLFEEVFFDGDAKEAAAFAYLGRLALRGEPGNVPGATGARGPRILGRVTPA